MGILCNIGARALAEVLLSLMTPPIGIVSPSCTVTCVYSLGKEKTLGG